MKKIGIGKKIGILVLGIVLLGLLVCLILMRTCKKNDDVDKEMFRKNKENLGTVLRYEEDGGITEKKKTKNEFEPEITFLFSNDGGMTYSDSLKEFKVGKTVYLQLIIKIKSKTKNVAKDVLDKYITKNKIPVECFFSIPNIKEVAANYFDGVPITPKIDELNHLTTYPLKVLASKKAEDWVFTFQFIPVMKSTVKASLIFEDGIDEIYNRQCTIVFVN